MILKNIKVRNFRSLSNVEYPNLQKFNVLLGRNNSGKSSLNSVLNLVSDTINGANNRKNWKGMLSNNDLNKSIEIELEFETSESERNMFAGILTNNSDEDATAAMMNSELGKKLIFKFKSPENQPERCYLLHLRQTLMSSMDGRMATIQKYNNGEQGEAPTSDVKILGELYSHAPHTRFNLDDLDIVSGRDIASVQIAYNNREMYFPRDVATSWPRRMLLDFLDGCFFFSSFRHSTRIQAVLGVDKLNQDGSNLTQVLTNLLTHDRQLFDNIDNTMSVAVPEIGRLQTPFVPGEQNSQITFISPFDNFQTELHSMGSGVEQLLMVSTLLHTTVGNRIIFLDEPESHLHPGAQRFLKEMLAKSPHQIFISTHSPIFIDQTNDAGLYQVKISHGKTEISEVELGEMGRIFSDLGIKTSDILSSDAIVFVEGQGDAEVISHWGKVLQHKLIEKNINFIQLGGGIAPERNLVARSRLITSLSANSPIPHVFILDRDEKSEEQIQGLQTALGEKIIFWKKREIENYLLSPVSIKATLIEKAKGTKPELNNLPTEAISSDIQDIATNLFGTILIKRIKSRLGGLPNGFLTPDAIKRLKTLHDDPNFIQLVTGSINTEIQEHASEESISQIIQQEKTLLEQQWGDDSIRLSICPGEEILSGIFTKYEFKYSKPDDTLSLAKNLPDSDIDEEIKAILVKINSLA